MESQQATAAATVNDTPAAGALDPMPKMLSPGGEAPRCSCVVLKEDGETESRTVPIVPNWERKELGGPPSIIGFYPGLNAIVLGVDIISINDMKTNKDRWLARKSKHSLPFPFEDKLLFGDVIAIRRQDAVHLDLSLKQWKDFEEDPEDWWWEKGRINEDGLRCTARFVLRFPAGVSKTEYFDQFSKYEKVRILAES
uniref:Uncharacterized protein n=1 Tax=Hemiselmis andersenii TaxID=464988 RepID=A0A6T8M9T6_HEMAN|mmetsp:Transcript_39994/g.93660  ORF Transcript_39994/g.93660 Transcript_39994/m.93660 type:complete len:197 (+) Transcript_39994:288-878(+)